MTDLNKISLKILSGGKGILAADESTGTMTKSLTLSMFLQMNRMNSYLEKLFLHQKV